jgi:hypothetical protein
MSNHKSNLKMIVSNLIKHNTINRDVIEKIIDMYIINHVSITNACSENWSFAIHKLINYNNIKLNVNHIKLIIISGNLEMIKYLNENWTSLYNDDNKLFSNINYNSNNSIVDLACSCGHLEIVKYLLENEIYKYWCTTNAVDWALEKGHLDVVKYLVSKNVRGTFNCLKKIYERNIFNNSNIELLNYINNNKYIFLSDIYIYRQIFDFNNLKN